MKAIKLSFWLLLSILSAAWLLADTLTPAPFTFFSFRAVMTQYTGVIGMGLMSAAMLLATRPRWLERPLHGLDKMYRLHKWLGVTGLAFAVIHWGWAQWPKWMVGWGWLTRPERRPPAEGMRSSVELWLRSQRGLAESWGEWAFYAAAILIVLALVKRFPYHWFKRTHRWLALVYLILVYHSVVLLKSAYWAQPVGWLTALLLLVGTASAVLALAGRVGRNRQVAGTIQALTFYPGLRVIEGVIQLEPGWTGHRPGQFAFVTSDRHDGAHPYTIASAWNPEERRLTFIVKELGDHTRQLHERLKIGMPVTVEGPYGCFDFTDRRPRQIWVGAGIGITPFIARMKQRARNSDQQAIDLFHPTGDYDRTAIDKLTADAEAAKVRLHVMVSPKDGRLTPERIRAAVPEWRSASLWFCGPAEFGEALRKDFTAHGLPAGDFHQELFEMR